jgi:hypothetical protein
MEIHRERRAIQVFLRYAEYPVDVRKPLFFRLQINEMRRCSSRPPSFGSSAMQNEAADSTSSGR